MASAIMGSVGSSIGSMAAGTFGWSAATWGQIGWTAGVLAANYLFAPDGPHTETEGPRLDDLKVTSSAFGGGIPKVYGAYRISGNIIWSLPLHETKHEETQESGKGSGGSSSTSTWYTYKGTWAIAFCEGPITAIRRIWFGSTLVWSTDKTSALKSGNSYLSKKTDNYFIYEGDGAQPVNYVIQSDKSDTPAYRNTCYLVVEGLELEDFGNRIPNVTAEIISSGEISTYLFSEQTKPFGKVMGYEMEIINVDEKYIYLYIQSGGQWKNNGEIMYKTTAMNRCDNPEPAIYTEQPLSWSIEKIALSSGLWVGTYRDAYLEYGCPDSYYDHPAGQQARNSKRKISGENRRLENVVAYRYGDDHMLWVNPINSAQYVKVTGNLNPYFNHIGDVHNGVEGDYTDRYFETEDGDMFLAQIALRQISKITGSGTYTYTEAEATIDPAYVLSGTAGFLAISAYLDFVYLFGISADYQLCSKYDFDLNLIWTRTMPKVISSGNKYFTVDKNGLHILTWTKVTHYDLEFETTHHYDLDDYWGGSHTETLYYKGNRSFAYQPEVVNENYDSLEIWNLESSSSNGESVASACKSIALEAGLSESDLNFSAAESIIIDGYVITKSMPARSAIDAILNTYDLLMVDTNHKLTIIPKKQDVVATITEEEVIGEIEYNKRQELDLLKRVTVKYSNNLSDYLSSTQSAMRIDVNATREEMIELPFALSDNQAKQYAEKSLYRDWIYRTTLSFSIPFSYNNLTVGTVISLPNGYNVKIVEIAYTEDNILNVKAILYSIVESTAVGADTGGNTSDLKSLNSDTVLEIANSPTISNNYIDEEGLYYTATGLDSNWPGAEVFSKREEVDDLETIGILLEGSVIGVVSGTPLGNTDKPNHWDLENSVQIRCYGDLIGATKESVLNGANYALIGNEMIQYSEAELLENGNYELSVLTRGRRGTESYVGNHNYSEVFISINNVNGVGFYKNLIGSKRYYSAVTLGEREQSDLKNVTNSGRNLKPFSPSYLKHQRVSKDIHLEWHRRSRYISGYFNPLPVSEANESYNISINDFSGAEIGVYTTTSTSFVYTEQFHLNDGVESGDPLIVKVSQISGVYGNGYETDMLIEPSFDEYGRLMSSYLPIHYFRLNNSHMANNGDDYFNEPDGTKLDSNTWITSNKATTIQNNSYTLASGDNILMVGAMQRMANTSMKINISAHNMDNSRDCNFILRTGQLHGGTSRYSDIYVGYNSVDGWYIHATLAYNPPASPTVIPDLTGKSFSIRLEYKGTTGSYARYEIYYSIDGGAEVTNYRIYLYAELVGYQFLSNSANIQIDSFENQWNAASIAYIGEDIGVSPKHFYVARSRDPVILEGDSIVNDSLYSTSFPDYRRYYYSRQQLSWMKDSSTTTVWFRIEEDPVPKWGSIVSADGTSFSIVCQHGIWTYAGVTFANVGDIVQGQWYFFVGTYDGTTTICYLNGIEVGQAAYAAVSNNDQYKIGPITGDYPILSMQDLSLLDKVLSPIQIKELYDIATI
ncbi:MAG: hypothetical protein DRI65_01820 [Chloroflexota bacterium]|nr:MAG: hypothetical protein DRI65_01820 [Chloroflexota bacterium]